MNLRTIVLIYSIALPTIACKTTATGSSTKGDLKLGEKSKEKFEADQALQKKNAELALELTVIKNSFSIFRSQFPPAKSKPLAALLDSYTPYAKLECVSVNKVADATNILVDAPITIYEKEYWMFSFAKDKGKRLGIWPTLLESANSEQSALDELDNKAKSSVGALAAQSKNSRWYTNIAFNPDHIRFTSPAASFIEIIGVSNDNQALKYDIYATFLLPDSKVKGLYWWKFCK